MKLFVCLSMTGAVGAMKMVSQTVRGNGKFSISGDGIPQAMTEHFSLLMAMDVDTLDIREDEFVKVKVPMPNHAGKIDMDVAMNLIFTANTRTAVVHSVQNMTIPGMPPKITKSCNYYMVPPSAVPGLDDVAKLSRCLERTSSAIQPVGTQGDLDEYELKIDIPDFANATGTVDERVYMDKEGVMRRIDGFVDMEMTETNKTIHEVFSFNATEAKAGPPDRGLFRTPPSWGKCSAGKIGMPSVVHWPHLPKNGIVHKAIDCLLHPTPDVVTV